MKMKKIIILTALVFSLLASAAYAGDYKEKYPWAVDSVEYCVKNKILQGDEYGNLMLENNLTQAQATALVMRSIPVDSNPLIGFKGIPSSHWAFTYVSDFSGYYILPNIFSADENITREMYFSMIVSAMGIPVENDRELMIETFKDCSKIRLEYLPYITTAYKCGLVKGSDNRIHPKDYLTRVEAVTVLYRALIIKGIIDAPLEPEIPEVVVPEQKPTEEVTPPEQDVVVPDIGFDDNYSEIVHIGTTPIMGEAKTTAERAKKWAKANGAAQRYIDIADTYWKYGEITGIRPDVLYVQAAKETAFGKYTGRVTPDMNNWAGIKKYGATGDETDDHESFATPDDGVRGHFNHMSAYVGVNPVGETHGRYKSVKSLAWAGTVKTVEALGGKWCPDPQYGVQIIEMLNTMLKY